MIFHTKPLPAAMLTKFQFPFNKLHLRNVSKISTIFFRGQRHWIAQWHAFDCPVAVLLASPGVSLWINSIRNLSALLAICVENPPIWRILHKKSQQCAFLCFELVDQIWDSPVKLDVDHSYGHGIMLVFGVSKPRPSRAMPCVLPTHQHCQPAQVNRHSYRADGTWQPTCSGNIAGI